MRIIRLSALAIILAGSSCVPANQPGQTPADETASPISEESKETARQGDEAMLAAQKQMDAQIEKNQTEIKTAMESALGKGAPGPGGQAAKSAATAIAEIRKAGITLHLAPVLDANGKQVAGQFVHLEDSFSKRVQEISPKIAKKKATKAEIKFVQEGAQQVGKINALKAQVRQAVMPAMQASWMVASGSMTTMQTIAAMVRTRRQMEMDWTDSDYKLVQQVLDRQSRREQVGALSIAMMAAYQAVFEKGAKPELIDEVAKAGLAAIPVEGKATTEQAKTYLENFEKNVDAAKQMYETQARKAFGDAQYEAQYKAQIDGAFAQMKAASSAKSASEVMAETGEQYKADLQKCARGEKPGPGSMVGPGACKKAKANAGPDGKLTDAAMAELTGGAKAVVEEAEGGLMSLLGSLPGVAQVKAAFDGVMALKDGDPAKALRAAAALVPVPGLSGVLETAAKGVDAVNDTKKKLSR